MAPIYVHMMVLCVLAVCKDAVYDLGVGGIDVRLPIRRFIPIDDQTVKIAGSSLFIKIGKRGRFVKRSFFFIGCLGVRVGNFQVCPVFFTFFFDFSEYS